MAVKYQTAEEWKKQQPAPAAQGAAPAHGQFQTAEDWKKQNTVKLNTGHSDMKSGILNGRPLNALIDEWEKYGYKTRGRGAAGLYNLKYRGMGYDDIQKALRNPNLDQNERDWAQRYMETDEAFHSGLTSAQISELLNGVNDRLSLARTTYADLPFMEDRLQGLDESSDEYNKLASIVNTRRQEEKGFLDRLNDSSITGDDRKKVLQEYMDWQNGVPWSDDVRDLEGRVGALSRAKTLADRREFVGNKYADYYAADLSGDSTDYAWMREGADGKSARDYNPLETYLRFRDASDEERLQNGVMVNDIVGQGDVSRWGYMTDQERKIYNRIYQEQGWDAAKEYLDDLSPMLNQKGTEEEKKAWEKEYHNASGWGQAGMLLESIPENVIGGAVAGASDLGGILTGNIDPNNAAHRWQNQAGSYRNAEAEEIIEWWGKEHPVAGQIMSNTFQAIMSAGDSLLGATLMGEGYTWAMGLGAGASKVQDMYNKGYSDVQMGIGFFSSGLIEVATEKVSVGNYLERFIRGDIHTMRQWAFETALQALGEGSEELASNVANLVVDSMIQAGSDPELLKLLNKGYEDNEAAMELFQQRAIEAMWDAYGGIVSGGFMGLTAGGANYAGNKMSDRTDMRETGRIIIENNGLQDLANQVQNTPGATKVQLKVAEALAKLTPEEFANMSKSEQKKVSMQAGMLNNIVSQANRKIDRGRYRDQIENKLNELFQNDAERDNGFAPSTETAQQDETSKPRNERPEESRYQDQRQRKTDALQQDMDARDNAAQPAAGAEAQTERHQRPEESRYQGRVQDKADQLQQSMEQRDSNADAAPKQTSKKKTVADLMNDLKGNFGSIKSQLEAIGVKNMREVAEALTKMQYDEKLSARERKIADIVGGAKNALSYAANLAKNAPATIKEFAQRFKDNTPQTVETVYNLGGEDQNLGEFARGYSYAYALGKGGADIEAALESPYTAGMSEQQITLAYEHGARDEDAVEQTRAPDYDYEETGEAFMVKDGDSEPVNIAAVDSFVNDGKETTMFLRTDDGDMVDAGAVTFTNYDTAKLYNDIPRMGMTVDEANQYIDYARESGMTLGQFVDAARQVYLAGRYGTGKSTALNRAGKLSTEVRDFLYGVGQRVRSENRGKGNTHRANTRNYDVRYTSQEGLKFEGFDPRMETLTDKQLADINAAKVLAKMGLDVSVYRSTAEDRANPNSDYYQNGTFDTKTGAIRFDLNAGRGGRGMAAFALSHELTHFVKEYSPDAYDDFADAVFSGMEQNKIDNFIADKLDQLMRMKEHKGKDIVDLYDIARDEAVAELCETILTDTDALQNVSSKLQQTNRSLWQKITDWIKDKLAKLRDFYRGADPDSDIAKAGRELISQNEQLLEAWSKAAAGAVENYAMETRTENAAETEQRNSERDSEGRELTEAQVEYFKDSKVRDENGNLKVMYRGGAEEFTVFDRKKAKSFAHYGNGFYFTESESQAKTYGNARAYYLNIMNPLMPNQHSITREQMKNFIQAIAENEDDYGLDNYGYGATVRSVLHDVWGKGDYEMIWDLNQTAIGNMVEAIELFNDVNGTDYDGIIVPSETVTFYSNQAKNVDNQNPTSNPDIRYSFRDDIITPESTDEERYVILKDFPVHYATVDGSKISDVNLEEYNTRKKSQVIKGLKELAAMLGLTNTDLNAFYIDFPFQWTQKNVGISVHHQLDHDENYSAMVKMMSCFNDLVEYSIPIETHLDKENGPHMREPGLKQVYTLMSAYSDGDTLTPVKLTVKEYTSSAPRLYLAVATNKINLAVLEEFGKDNPAYSPLFARSVFRLQDIIANVNATNGEFLKYIPNQMLNAAQIAAKENALAKERGKYARINQTARNSTRDTSAENAKLRADIANLRDLVKMQGKLTGGKVWTQRSLNTAASFIMRETGRMLDSEGKAELAQMLSEAYNVLSDENVSYNQVVEQCMKVAEWLDENGYTEDAMDEYAESVLGEMKGIAIRLDDTQKAEARHLFGSLQEFRSRIAGTYKLSDNGVPLDDIWNGLAIEHPAFFSADESSAGLPGSLVEAIDRLRNTKNLDQYQHMSVDDMMQKVYEGFWKAKRMTTVADKYQAKIDEIMKKHDAEIKELKQTSKNNLEDAVYRLRISMQAQQAVERAEFEADRKQMQRDYKRQMEQLRKEYSTDTQTMEREFLRLLKQYEKQSDKSTDLKERLDKELKKHKADNKDWAQSFDKMYRMYEAEGRNIQKLEEKLTQMRESAKAKVESRRMTEERQKVKNAVGELNRMLLNPTKGSYVPTSLQESVAAMLNAVNMEGRDYSALKAKYRKEIREFNKKGKTDKMADSYRKLERIVDQESRFRNAMLDLQTKYKSFQKSGDAAEYMAYNQTIANLFERYMEEVGSTPLHEMNRYQLELTKDIIRGVTAQIRDANKLKAIGEYTDAVETIKTWQAEMGDAFMPGKNYEKWLQRYFLQQFRPDTFFKATSGFKKGSVGEKMANMFVSGNVRMLKTEQEFENLFAGILSDKKAAKQLDKYQSTKKDDLVFWGMHDGAGNKVWTSRGIMLQAYMLLKQEDSFESLLYGRFKMPNMDSYYKGNHTESYGSMEDINRYSSSDGETLLGLDKELEKLQKQQRKGDDSPQTAERIAELMYQREKIVGGRLAELSDMMNQIQAQMTDTDIALVNLADAWYERSGDLMSETFEGLNGFKPKRAKNYTPIHRDASTIFSVNTTAAVDIINLSNAGFTKERVKSTKPILLTDFFEELGQQKAKVARYYGFAQIQQDFNKVYKTANPDTGTTVHGKMESIFGTGDTKQTKRGFGVTGTKWIDNFIADIAGSRQSSGDVLSWLYGNAAAATLGANIRVSLSQLASIPNAAAEVGMKNMIKGAATGFKGAFSKAEREALAEKNVYFWQRYRGEGSSRELADIRNADGIWGKVAKSRFGKALLNWCQDMDVLATGKMMWNMAEFTVQDTGVKPGDANYEELVNAKYTDILRKTQPNYTVTERSDLLRDKRGGMKFLTMYKTQSNQNMNILMEANLEYNKMKRDLRDGKNGVTKADVDAARNRMVWSYSSLLTSAALFAAIRFIGNAALRKLKPYKDDETGETDVKSVLSGISNDAFSSIAGMLSGGSLVYDAAMAVATKGNYYGVSDSAFGLINDAFEAGVKWLQDTGDTSKLKKATLSSLKLFGIPADNAWKIADALYGWSKVAVGKEDFWGDDEATKKQMRNRVVQAYLNDDDEAMAKAVMYLMEQSNKILEAEQRSEVYSAIQNNEIKDFYISGKWGKEKTTKFLRDALERDNGKIEDVFTNWDFEIKYPGTANAAYREMSAKQKRAFESIQKEVGLKDYYLILKEISKITRDDANGDGKTDTGSKKNKIVAYIMKLKISDAAKRVIWDTVKSGSDKGTPWE